MAGTSSSYPIKQKTTGKYASKSEEESGRVGRIEYGRRHSSL